MAMTTARQKVLAYLKKNRLASAQEIARALHVTPANARHHLRILAADGRVTVVSAGGEGRGRKGKAPVETELAETTENGLTQGRHAPEETQAGLDFQQHGGGVEADGGGETRRPAGDFDQGGALEARVAVDQQQRGG